ALTRRDIMTRGLGIVGTAFVVALALAPRNADAQQISACVNNHSGDVRIVAQGASCKGGESPLTWNVAGPAGPQGPQGIQGAQGPQGIQGPAGQALAARAFTCDGPISTQSIVTFVADNSGTNFGSSISAPPILLQPGIYQIHLETDIENIT